MRRIATYIEGGDTKALTRLPGIGRRAAELIVAELKGKLKEFAVGSAPRDAIEAPTWSSAQRDAVEVLVAWGDPRDDAERWLARASDLHPDIEQTDEWVRAAYRVKTGIEPAGAPGPSLR
jgi:Holliday junction DNA helicase RuvA